MWCQQGSQVNARGLSAPKSLFMTGLFLISVVRCPFFSCLSVFRAQKIRTWGSPTLYLCPKSVRDPAEKTLWPGDNDHTSFPSCLSLFDYNLSKPVLNMARVRSDSILLFLFSKWYVFVWEGESAAGEKKTGRRRQEKCVCMCLRCVRASVSLSLFSLSLSLSLSLPPSCLHSILAFFPSAYLFWMDFSCLYLCPCLFVCLRLCHFPCRCLSLSLFVSLSRSVTRRVFVYTCTKSHTHVQYHTKMNKNARDSKERLAADTSKHNTPLLPPPPQEPVEWVRGHTSTPWNNQGHHHPCRYLRKHTSLLRKNSPIVRKYRIVFLAAKERQVCLSVRKSACWGLHHVCPQLLCLCHFCLWIF